MRERFQFSGNWEMRLCLELAADRSGRTLAKEIEERVARSFGVAFDDGPLLELNELVALATTRLGDAELKELIEGVRQDMLGKVRGT